MAILQIRCPHCSATLKTSADPTAGKQIRCPKCDELFRPGAAAANSSPASSTALKKKSSKPDLDLDDEEDTPVRRKTSMKSTSPSKATSRRDEEDEDDDRPRSKSKRRRDDEDAPRSKGLLIGLVAGGGVAIIAAVVLVIVLSNKGDSTPTQPDPLAQRPDPQPFKDMNAVKPDDRQPPKDGGFFNPGDKAQPKDDKKDDKPPDDQRKPGGGLSEADRLNQLKLLALMSLSYYDSYKKPATSIDDLLPFLKSVQDSDKLIAKVRSGDIVIVWGVNMKDTPQGLDRAVFAYDKDVPTRGGCVVLGNAEAKKMTPQEFTAAAVKAPDDQPKPVEGQAIQAGALTKSFQDDEKAASALYTGKPITITGVIDALKGGQAAEGIILKGHGAFTSVLCTGFEGKDLKEIYRQARKNPVTIAGVCGGKSKALGVEVQMTDCKLVEKPEQPREWDGKPITVELQTSTDGRYVILMPKGDVKKSTNRIRSFFGPMTAHTLSVELPGKKGIVGVSYTDYAEQIIQLTGVDKLLESGSLLALAQIGGKVVADKPIKVNGFPAREIIIQKDSDLVYKSRVVLAKPRLYQITVSGDTEALTDELATKIFYSFKIDGAQADDPPKPDPDNPADVSRGWKVVSVSFAKYTFKMKMPEDSGTITGDELAQIVSPEKSSPGAGSNMYFQVQTKGMGDSFDGYLKTAKTQGPADTRSYGNVKWVLAKPKGSGYVATTFIGNLKLQMGLSTKASEAEAAAFLGSFRYTSPDEKALKDIPMKFKGTSFVFRGPAAAQIPDAPTSMHVDFVMWSYPSLGEGNFGETPKYKVHASRLNSTLQQVLKEESVLGARKARIATYGANEGVYSSPTAFDRVHSFKCLLGGYKIDMEASSKLTDEEIKAFFGSLKMTEGQAPDTTPRADRDFQKYTPKLGSYSITLPKFMVADLVKGENRIDGRVGHSFVEAQLQRPLPTRIYYAITYDYMAKTVEEKGADGMLAIAREEVKNRYRLSKLESENKVTVGDNPGLDLVLNNRNEHYRVRCLLVGNRVYVLALYVLSPEKGNAEQIAKEYFDSFKLLK